jgi:hypothetical protein
MDRSHFRHFAQEANVGAVPMAKTLVAVRSSEIDFVAVLVQQQYVIGLSLENFATKLFQGKGNF